MPENDPLRQLWLAAVLLTRLPLPHLPVQSFTDGARAVWAYPLVGIAVGGIGALAGHAALWLGLPVIAAAALALGGMILVTGAMHEDGLADVADGFWGGFTPERRLQIMRDSQIGTYGVLALGVVFTLRLAALATLLPLGWGPLVMAAALSRAVIPVVMYVLPHARKDGLSHSVGNPHAAAVLASCGFGAGAAIICLGAAGAVVICIAFAVGVGIVALAKRKIEGQTGDVLGAVQQLAEAAVLLTCAALLGT